MTDLDLSHIGESPFAVTTDRVAKAYGNVAALRGVDLRVPESAVYALVGSNGAGKSTLIRSLMHLVRPDAGELSVLGIDVRRSGAEARARLGYVPEGHGLGHSWLTVGRLIRHQAAFLPMWDEAYAVRLAKAFEIRPEQKCGELSKGQSRRVQLLLALAHRPPVLLLDEPGDGLDHIARDRVLSLLTEHLADSPTTVLLSTHRVHEFERLVDHIGVLQGGVLLAQTTRDRLQQLLRRYRADVPAGWTAPADLGTAVLRRAALGRQIDWTVWGDERQVVGRLTRAGAVVRESAPLTLDDAAVALLSREVAA